MASGEMTLREVLLASVVDAYEALEQAARKFCDEVERNGFHHQLYIVNAITALDEKEKEK